MRAPLLRIGLPDELVIDNFAGGGGASVGIEAALGRPVDYAINHDARALAVHAANHPHTTHLQSDVWEVDPRALCGSRRVGLLWASPACTHFSKAKGSTNPLSAKIRSLAWVVVRWAREVRPRVIIVENVEEFATWGPLGADGRPRADQLGRTFRAWLGKLSDLGYVSDIRSLVAADYGTPTLRRRLFVILRCDGEPIVWPEPTHGPTRPARWRTAAECIDWKIPCRSIFGRPRPLAPATLRRIAAGIDRYVLRGRPFILPVTHPKDARVHGLDEPLRTVTAAHRGELAICAPFIVRHGHYSTKTGAGLVEGCGAGTFRGQPLERPMSTVCATDDRHLVCPVIVPHYGGAGGHPTAPRSVEAPLPTVTTKDHTSLAAAWLTKLYGAARHGAPLDAPMPTVLAGGGRGGGHAALTAAFLVQYNGAGGHPLTRSLELPLGTVVSHDRFGLVTIDGEPYQIEDIGLRMLDPEELKRAQGFPDAYDLSPAGTKTAKTAIVGNSVCSQVAEAVIVANVGRTEPGHFLGGAIGPASGSIYPPGSTGGFPDSGPETCPDSWGSPETAPGVLRNPGRGLRGSGRGLESGHLVGAPEADGRLDA